MLTRRSYRFTAGAAAACCLAVGVAAVGVAAVVSGGAAAQAPQPATPLETRATVVHVGDEVDDRHGGASMSSPFIKGVPHVPANVLLALGPDGEASYVGPEGSLFNGPVDEVDARLDAWWAEQMAAGVSPEEADGMLAHPSK